MRVAMGADKRTDTTEAVVRYLNSIKVKVDLLGDLKKGGDKNWVNISSDVSKLVSSGKADEGILFCWTGTGVALVANRNKKIRAATVSSVRIAKQARAWNHANVLCMSCFISPKKAVAIVKEWLKTPYSKDEDDLNAIKEIGEL